MLEYNSGVDMELLQRAYIFSAKVHEGQERLSGEPYLVHPLEVAGILVELRMDEEHNVFLGDGRPYKKGSYAVLSVKRVNEVAPEFQIEAKIAKLLSQLDDDSKLAEATRGFLEETVTTASN